MSKRNFVLLIIILVVAVAAIFGYLYLQSSKNGGTGETGGTNFLSQFNPFASKANPGSDQNPTPSGENNPIIDESSPDELASVKLTKISSVPVAGYSLFSKERLKAVPLPVPQASADINTASTTASTTVVMKKKNGKAVAPATEFAPAIRYVDRATGNIYQTFLDKIEERKFSTTIIPEIYDAYFGSKAMKVVMRHLKSDQTTIETFSGSLPKEILGEDRDSNEITGSFLGDGIKDISVSPDASKIFYLQTIGNASFGTILNLADGKKTTSFSSVFTEWNSSWPTGNTITMTTKPSGLVPGHMYAFDIVKKTFTKILGDINGLTTQMGPNGKSVLVNNSSLALFLYHTDTKTYDRLGVDTLPEKCTWSKNSENVYCAVPSFVDTGTYPDDWYKGEVSFSDQIWKIELKSGITTLIADPALVPGGQDTDGIKLTVDDNETHLFFINKKDSFLWMLDLR